MNKKEFIHEYDVEIYGENNSFQLHVAFTQDEEFYYLKSVMLKHGMFQREVLHILTDEQIEQIENEIKRQQDEDYQDWLAYQAELAAENKLAALQADYC